jgi:3-oxoadipate enol-lactonase
MAAEPVGAIESEGRRLAWRTVGAGPPLLLVNGYAATAGDWDPGFLEALGRSFEVICPDNRGVGGSQLGEGELTVDGMAVDLEALLDALAIERASVVGWSMGGFVAHQLALRAPGRVAALALLATDPGGPDSVPADPEAWARLTDHSGSARDQATRLISLLFPQPLAASIDAEFGEVVAAARAQLLPKTLRAQEAAMDAWHRDGPRPGSHPQAVPPDETPPALILHGDLDAVIPPANAHALAAHWPGARVDLFSGCGHALMAQEPERAAAMIGALARG